MSRRKLLQVSILWGEPPVPFKYRFFVRPLRGRGERENQGTPLKPRQGPCPWTPLPKNLYLKGEAPSPPRAPTRDGHTLVQHEQRNGTASGREILSSSLWYWS